MAVRTVTHISVSGAKLKRKLCAISLSGTFPIA